MLKKTKTSSRYSTYLEKVGEVYQKKEVKVYFSLILTLLTIAFFAFFAIKPTMVTIASLIKEIKDEKEVYLRLEKKLEDLSAAQKQYALLKADLHLIESALPEKAQVSYFLGQIEILAQENHLNLSSVQTGRVTLKGTKEATTKKKSGQEKSPYPAINISLTLGGSYQDIENFTRSIANLRRITNVKNFSIKKGGKSSLKGLGQSMEIETFYLPTSQN